MQYIIYNLHNYNNLYNFNIQYIVYNLNIK